MEIRSFSLGNLDALLEELEEVGIALVRAPDVWACGTYMMRVAGEHFAADRRSRAEPTRTMFPQRLANHPELPSRKVFQFHADPIGKTVIAVPPQVAAVGEDLEATMRIRVIRPLVNAIIARYGLDALADHLRDAEQWVLNAVRYPHDPSRHGELLFPEHPDWGLLSVYAGIGGPGLDALVRGEWVPVDGNHSGDLLVYGGAMLSLLTRRRIRPLRHRVRQLGTMDRDVALYYVDPPRAMPLPTGQTAGEYTDMLLREIGQL